MQLREEVRTANRDECPVNDWTCKFFDNGGCTLRDKDICSLWGRHAETNRAVDK